MGGKCVEEPLHLLLDQGVTSDVGVPLGELLLIGQLAEEQEIGDLEELGVEGEVFD